VSDVAELAYSLVVSVGQHQDAAEQVSHWVSLRLGLMSLGLPFQDSVQDLTAVNPSRSLPAGGSRD
jgi:hypothetical protein